MPRQSLGDLDVGNHGHRDSSDYSWLRPVNRKPVRSEEIKADRAIDIERSVRKRTPMRNLKDDK